MVYDNDGPIYSMLTGKPLGTYSFKCTEVPFIGTYYWEAGYAPTNYGDCQDCPNGYAWTNSGPLGCVYGDAPEPCSCGSCGQNNVNTVCTDTCYCL